MAGSVPRGGAGCPDEHAAAGGFCMVYRVRGGSDADGVSPEVRDDNPTRSHEFLEASVPIKPVGSFLSIGTKIDPHG